MVTLAMLTGRNPVMRLVSAGLTGFVDGVTGHSDFHPVPVLGLVAGIPLQCWLDRRGRPSDILDGIVDGAAATAGRAIGAHWIYSAAERPLVAHPYALGYRPIPKREI